MQDSEYPGQKAYPLGHSKRELVRLADQARINDPLTRQFLRDAGIASGMRVLEVGSAAGYLAFLLADIVGPTGEVVGVDLASGAVTAARQGASVRSLTNVGFLQGDPSEMRFDKPFDAVVGRWVMMFIPDKIGFINKLSGHLKPGGIMFFQEVDRLGTRSFPPAPLYDRCHRWITEAMMANGDDARMGTKLYSNFIAAGLPPPLMRIEALIGGGTNAANDLWQLAELVRSLVPTMEKFGVATAKEVGVDDLSERLVAEAIDSQSVLVDRSEIAAWSRKKWN